MAVLSHGSAYVISCGEMGIYPNKQHFQAHAHFSTYEIDLDIDGFHTRPQKYHD